MCCYTQRCSYAQVAATTRAVLILSQKYPGKPFLEISWEKSWRGTGPCSPRLEQRGGFGRCSKLQQDPTSRCTTLFASHANTARTLSISAVQLQTASRRHTPSPESSPLLLFLQRGETVPVMFSLPPLKLHPYSLSKSQENPKYPPSNLVCHPGGNPGAKLKSISHRCHPILVAVVWELTKETIELPLGCLQGGNKLIKTGPEFRFVKQLVLVQIVKLGDFKTPLSL